MINNTYEIALKKILNYWANSQDLTTPPIQCAEHMAGIACEALDYVRGVDKEKPDWLTEA